MTTQYFQPGDVVTLRQSVEHKPKMIVEKLIRLNTANKDQGKLMGIRCFWFDSTGALHKHTFSSKDLEVA